MAVSWDLMVLFLLGRKLNWGPFARPERGAQDESKMSNRLVREDLE